MKDLLLLTDRWTLFGNTDSGFAGFLSGAAIFGQLDALHDRTGAEVIGWIDDYCDNHPSIDNPAGRRSIHPCERGVGRFAMTVFVAALSSMGCSSDCISLVEILFCLRSMDATASTLGELVKSFSRASALSS